MEKSEPLIDEKLIRNWEPGSLKRIIASQPILTWKIKISPYFEKLSKRYFKERVFDESLAFAFLAQLP